jgi:hypothetical protein
MPSQRSRRFLRQAFFCLVAIAAVAMGCTAPLFRAQNSEPDELDALVEWSEDENRVRLVGDLAVPWGLTWLKVDGVALVTKLNGTGSDPPPSPTRDKLIKEMQTHDVKSYSRALASDDTAMVLVRGYIPPGARKDDVFDVEVQIPTRSKTDSLKNGWLMQARLREYKVLDRVREGDVAALANGSILVDSVFRASDPEVTATRGRIPGGGVVQKSRTLGLAISNEHSSVRTSARIGAAINERFHHFHRGSKKGVANPKRDNMIDLAVHPRYRHNLGRYIRVIRSIAVGEAPSARTARLMTLRRMLFEPTSAEAASLQLEAIGSESVAILREGITSPDPEVRFYAAEALAYLDAPEAAGPLRDAAENERAFRWRGLTALAAMDSYEAQDMLTGLMHVPSAETRYGAFRALRMRNHRDPLVKGQVLNGQFAYHRIPSAAEPLIHFSRSRRPELVLCGSDIRMRPPNFLYAGDTVLIKRLDDDTLQVSCFRPGKEDRYEQCSTQLDDLIQAVAEVGGSYGDLFEGLQTAKARGYLDVKIELDAIPSSRRRYRRKTSTDDAPVGSGFHVSHPIPDVFQDRLEEAADQMQDPSDQYDDVLDGVPGDDTPKGGFLDRMTSWMNE